MPSLGTKIENGPWVQFDLEADDIADFNLHLIDRSRLNRGQNRLIALILVCVVVATVPWLLLPRVPWVLVYPMFVFALIPLITRLFNKRLIRRNVHRLMSEADNQNMLGIQELQATPDAVIHRSIACESRYQPTAFVRIDETQQHWFLFTSSLHAIIVPKQSITGGNAADVVQSIHPT